MGICYIVGAGDYTPLPEINKDDFIIAADGGFDSLARDGLTPNLLIGDLDSIKNAPPSIETLRFNEKKDETDMHLAYLEGARRGFKSFALYGGTGGRADHTFANYSLLYYITKAGHEAKLVDKKYEARVIESTETSLSGEVGKYFSVFAIGGKAHGISIKNAAYELENGTLSPEFPLGVSNRFCDTPTHLSVKSGALLIISEK